MHEKDFERASSKVKVRAVNLTKIFGSAPSQALSLLAEGKTKDQIFEATGQTVGVRNASFEVSAGEIFVVMGLSGSGKSTLVRMINGIIKPSAGKIVIDGIDVASCSDEQLRSVRREKVAMVFQHFALFPHKTVAENVAFGLKVRGVPPQQRLERAHAALEQVGLAPRADSYPDELSGGMQQRVGLARGLASEPDILLMDEPFSALDPLIRADMQKELLELQHSLKKTIVFITHDLNEAMTLGNTIAIMRGGEIVQTGTAQEIAARPANEYVAAFTRDIDRSLVFTAGSIATPPQAIDLDAGHPDAAMRRMEEIGADALHVVSRGELAGIVTYRSASAASRNGADLKSILMEDFPTALPQVRLVELYPLAQAGLPIALTDETGHFAGVVEPRTVFGVLAGGSTAS